MSPCCLSFTVGGVMVQFALGSVHPTQVLEGMGFFQFEGQGQQQGIFTVGGRELDAYGQAIVSLAQGQGDAGAAGGVGGGG
ncbi:MAG: hypothetical protein ACFE0K_02685 [Alcanivorax sp.]|uniref:hypothetical protein n=1 Tax=Alcanivorax sp. TaxID=1872427 RepID=UPI003DA6FD2D